MSYVHAIVWLDHLNARIFAFSDGDGETIPIESQSEQRQLHRKSGKPGSAHAPDEVALFGEIVAAVADVREILITGPGTAKLAFRRYVEQRNNELAQRTVGAEPTNNPRAAHLPE